MRLLPAATLGISRQTFYRWWRRYDPHNLSTLEDRSHRPHRHRQPTWTPSQSEAVLALRREYPRWGKDKLVVLLGRKNLRLSTSMVGRILNDLKRRGVLVETPGENSGPAPQDARPSLGPAKAPFLAYSKAG